MRRLIEDLLDATAIDAGRLSIHAAPEPPHALVAAALDAFGPAAREKDVRLVGGADAALPAVRADHDRVLQVLGNLLSNAIKVSAAGARVAVEAERRGAEVVFRVRDEGPGVPDAGRPHLFEPYRRGANTAYRGTGLGLTIARGIVEAHGGRIWLDSVEGRGTTVSFTLPVASEGTHADAPSASA